MIRAVLDTNVLASGIAGFLITESTPGKLLQLWRNGQYQLNISQHIRNELTRTLQKPYFQQQVKPEQITKLSSLLDQDAILVPLTVKVSGKATHPEDDLILATAVSAKAQYLVTGDEALRRKVPTYKGVKLVSAREFLEILESIS